MLWMKRVVCGIIALSLIIIGALLTENTNQLWQALGFCLFIGGITLSYIALFLHLPSYSFWITLIAIGLAYMLYTTRSFYNSFDDRHYLSISSEKMSQEHSFKSDTSEVKKKETALNSLGFNLSSYPKISGSATVIHANIFYIGGRYIRLYGIDAPDNDQMCSSATGSSYNCGEEAASWVRNWIDQNPIDCYLLKVEPEGLDVAACLWGEYDIGAALVKAGWGLVDAGESDVYHPYEIIAKNESSGLWQGSFYSPRDWRDIKAHRKDFTIKKRMRFRGGNLFNFGSLF